MASLIDSSTASRVERLKRIYFERRQSLAAFNQAQTEELEYNLKGVHWKVAAERYGPAERIQPCGRELLNETLHMAAEIGGSEQYLDIRPIDREVDPWIASLVKSVMEWQMNDPSKHYRLLRKRMSKFALSGRLWGLALDYDPGIGRYGETLVREVDGRRTGWPNAFFNPADLKCPWWYETQRLPRDLVRYQEGWKNNSSPITDNDPIFSAGGSGGGDPAQDQGEDNGDLVTVVRFWEKDLTRVRVPRESDERDLSPDQRFMACGFTDQEGCGWKSPTQERLGFALPEVDPGRCPTCRGDLHRRDAVMPEDEYLVYPKGRLTIFSPSEEKSYYDDQWPQKTRGFPCLMYAVRDYPWEIAGQSLTSEMWDTQTSIDVLDRVGIEHIMKALPYMAMPEGRVTDFRGEEWYGGEDQGLLMLYKTSGGSLHGIEMIQATGAPAAWGQMRDAYGARFERVKASADMRLDPERSRNIPESTFSQMVQSASVTTNDLIDTLRHLESPFIGCWWDILRDPSTNPEERLARFLGDDGQWKLEALNLPDMPNFDFVISTNPGLAKATMEDAQKIVYVSQQNPPTRKLLARALNIPITDLTEFEQDMAEFEAAQAQAAVEAEVRTASLNPKNSGAPAANGKKTARPGPGAPTNGNGTAPAGAFPQ